MKKEEKVAEDFLTRQGYKCITYEPLGKSTSPDFSIDGNIGIEVRRLNKQICLNGKTEPIESFKYKFVPLFRKILKELENQDLPFSIGVTLRYCRPIIITRQLLEELKTSITKSTISELYGVTIVFNNQITYLLYKGNVKSDQTYELISISDKDKGGNVQDARYNALKICISEKSEKLKDINGKFTELWLILIDDIFSRVDYTTKQDLQRVPEIKSIFNRIVMISFMDSLRWIDLYPWKISNNPYIG